MRNGASQGVPAWAFVLALACVSLACNSIDDEAVANGDRAAADESDGSSDGPDTTTDAAAAAASDPFGNPPSGVGEADAGPMRPPVQDETCVAAQELDSCCGQVRAVTRTELLAETCLAPVAAASAQREQGDGSCIPDCDQRDCSPDFSSVAARVGGQCVLTDECESDSDCVQLPEDRACKCCATVGPRALLERDWPELSCEPPQCSLAECLPVDGVPACRVGLDGKRHCQVGPDSCAGREEEADRWLRTHAHCARDEDCTLARVEAPCLPAFVCEVAVRTDVETDVFEGGARHLAEQYEQRCDTCVIADCADPASLRAVCRDAECVVESE